MSAAALPLALAALVPVLIGPLPAECHAGSCRAKDRLERSKRGI